MTTVFITTISSTNLSDIKGCWTFLIRYDFSSILFHNRPTISISSQMFWSKMKYWLGFQTDAHKMALSAHEEPFWNPPDRTSYGTSITSSETKLNGNFWNASWRENWIFSQFTTTWSSRSKIISQFELVCTSRDMGQNFVMTVRHSHF